MYMLANCCGRLQTRGVSAICQIPTGADTSVQALADVDQSCKGNLSPPMPYGKREPPCRVLKLELEGNTCQGDCCDFCFGVRCSPGVFVERAVSVGHPFSFSRVAGGSQDHLHVCGRV